jgi:hypothetical protein
MSPVQVLSVLGVLNLSKSDVHLSHVQKFSTCLLKKLNNHFTRNTVSNTDVLLGLVRKVMDTNAVSAAQRTQFPLNVPY